MKVFLLLLLSAIAAVAAAPADVAAQYGRPVLYVDGMLHYPEFSLRFVGLKEYRPSGTRLRYQAYVFDVLGTDGRKIADLDFMAAELYDTCMGFTVRDGTFVAEIHRSTAGKPLDSRSDGEAGVDLPGGTIVVWNLETARSGNPRLLKEFERFGANQTPDPTSMAVTRPADAGHAPATAVGHL